MAERGFSNKALAKEISFHEVTISKLKCEKYMPNRLERETLERLCTALNCQPGDLLRWQSTTEEDEEDSNYEQPDSSLPLAKEDSDTYKPEKKNSKTLKAKAKKARTQTWEELRKPLKISKVQV
ncbi:helix-turn-helix transcriptional regulator [Brasilonema sp. CT11]|nr:helix-turn-helix transcriptional regulator [Brasilonema sp. CT11]